MRVDITFLPALAAAFMLMFARIGTMMMLLPGLGETGVPSRVRLVAALVLTAVLLPLHRSAYHVDLRTLGPVLVAFAQELLIGAMLGLTARLTLSALQVAGSIVAQQLGLGFVTAVDPTQGQQGIIVGNFLTMLGITVLFATNCIISSSPRSTTATPCSARARFRSPATWPRSSPEPPPVHSASACSFPRRSWCSGSCSISALACSRG